MTTIDFQEVRTSNDLQTVVENYLGPPVRAGKWLCPFHDDGKNPNFTIKGDHFRCWSVRCNARGDVADFIQRIKNLSNPVEAARWLNNEPLPVIALPISSNGHNPTQSIPDLTVRATHYHSQVGLAMNYWKNQGLTSETVNRYQLGYANHCPTYRESSSYVIPIYQTGGLVSIRHRLASPNGTGKYRPECAGLKAKLFNVDCLQPDPDAQGQVDFSRWHLPEKEAILVEGEVKAMVLDQRCFRAVGLPGATTWQSGWLDFFEQMSRIYICLDPDIGQDQINRIAEDFLGTGKEVIKVELTCKPDDFFVLYGGTIEQFKFYLNAGRIVR